MACNGKQSAEHPCSMHEIYENVASGVVITVKGISPKTAVSDTIDQKIGYVRIAVRFVPSSAVSKPAALRLYDPVNVCFHQSRYQRTYFPNRSCPQCVTLSPQCVVNRMYRMAVTPSVTRLDLAFFQPRRLSPLSDKVEPEMQILTWLNIFEEA